MLEFRNIYKSFGRPILENLSFILHEGESLGFFGPSGIGKSTIINLILGHIEADQGIIINKFEKTSTIFQDNRLIENISAIDNLLLVDDDYIKAGEILSELSINDYHKKTTEFSGGEKRRISIARSLFYGGDLLLLDEPIKGLDKESRQSTIDCINKFGASSKLLISHDREDFKDLKIRKIIYL